MTSLSIVLAFFGIAGLLLLVLTAASLRASPKRFERLAVVCLLWIAIGVGLALSFSRASRLAYRVDGDLIYRREIAQRTDTATDTDTALTETMYITDTATLDTAIDAGMKEMTAREKLAIIRSRATTTTSDE